MQTRPQAGSTIRAVIRNRKVTDANECEAYPDQPCPVYETQDTRNRSQGKKKKKRQAIMRRKKIMNQKTIKNQQHDIVIEGLVLQAEMAYHKGQQAELNRDTQKLAYLLKYPGSSRLGHGTGVSAGPEMEAETRLIDQTLRYY